MPRRAAWTLSRLGEKRIEWDIVETMSTETIRRTLKKRAQAVWLGELKECGCIPPRHNAECVCAMEDVLETYSRTFDADEVLVCLDETSRQQTKETRTPLPTRPGPVPVIRGLMTSRMNAPDPIGYRQPVHALCTADRVAAC